MKATFQIHEDAVNPKGQLYFFFPKTMDATVQDIVISSAGSEQVSSENVQQTATESLQ